MESSCYWFSWLFRSLFLVNKVCTYIKSCLVDKLPRQFVHRQFVPYFVKNGLNGGDFLTECLMWALCKLWQISSIASACKLMIALIFITVQGWNIRDYLSHEKILRFRHSDWGAREALFHSRKDTRTLSFINIHYWGTLRWPLYVLIARMSCCCEWRHWTSMVRAQRYRGVSGLRFKSRH